MVIRRKVQKVVDGDTFKVARSICRSNFVRIAGKNSPEKYQFGGKQATQRLRRQIQGRVITLKPVGRSYGRVVARVRVNRRLVSNYKGKFP